MSIGAFSVSLTVKDISISKVFYEKLGFHVFGGIEEQNWLIMKNGYCTIGLFQGLFDSNILTFNPGWDSDANTLTDFKDIRVLQKEFKEKGIELKEHANEETSGPAFITLTDPDGNEILIDQHV